MLTIGSAGTIYHHADAPCVRLEQRHHLLWQGHTLLPIGSLRLLKFEARKVRLKAVCRHITLFALPTGSPRVDADELFAKADHGQVNSQVRCRRDTDDLANIFKTNIFKAPSREHQVQNQCFQGASLERQVLGHDVRCSEVINNEIKDIGGLARRKPRFMLAAATDKALVGE